MRFRGSAKIRKRYTFSLSLVNEIVRVLARFRCPVLEGGGAFIKTGSAVREGGMLEAGGFTGRAE